MAKQQLKKQESKSTELQEMTDRWNKSSEAAQKLGEENLSLTKELSTLRAKVKMLEEDQSKEPSNMTLDLKQVLSAITEERGRQDAKWGEQNHPDGTGTPEYKKMADAARDSCERAFKEGKGTWKHILTEEFMEAMAESDEEKLVTELIQTLAVGASWIEAIRRRQRGREAQGQVKTG